jgi:predicted esterase
LAADINFNAAYDLALQATAYLRPDQYSTLARDIVRRVNIATVPPGAEVYRKDVRAPDSEWKLIGRTPLTQAIVPKGYFRYRFELAGYETAYELAPANAVDQTYRLMPAMAPPLSGMVRVSPPPVPPLQFGITPVGVLQIDLVAPYDIDQYEVSNREYKAFLDAGGYSHREFWKIPFSEGGSAVTWENAMKRFVDTTGRPGPASWEGGIYRDGLDEFPVGGVSWYEAAAYAEYAGKALPTIYHWYRASDPRTAAYVIPASNFGRQGPRMRGQAQAQGPFGTSDMAGNVREWCWNQGPEDMRFIAGGGWGSAVYMFTNADAQPAFDRSPMNGFRCVRYLSRPPPELLAARTNRARDYSLETPATDDAFRAFRRIYDYDPKPLNASVDSVDDTSPYWRRERISYDAAYDERMFGYLLTPKNAQPPYQTLVYFPGAGAAVAESSKTLLEMERLDAALRSGRALMYPVYKGYMERRVPVPGTPLAQRTLQVQKVQDVRRSLDYLASRKDIDLSRLTYAGASAGSSIAPIVLATDDRFRAAILMDGGLPPGKPLPEVDPFNFAPRVRIPVLMLNGRYDFTFPPELCQQPLYRTLGTPAADKKYVLVDSAHDVANRRTEVVREILDWLDRYLGPVKR